MLEHVKSVGDLRLLYHNHCKGNMKIFRSFLQDLPESDRTKLQEVAGLKGQDWGESLEGVAKIAQGEEEVKKKQPRVKHKAKADNQKEILEAESGAFIEVPRYRNVTPAIPEKERTEIKESIRLLGQLNPIDVLNGTMEILDGHHRWDIIKELNEEGQKIAVKYRVVDIPDEDKRIEYIKALNEKRRHIVRLEEAKKVAAILEETKKETKERKTANRQATMRGEKSKGEGVKSTVQAAIEKAGAGISEAYQKRYNFVVKNKDRFPEIAEAMNKNEMPIKAAYEEVKDRIFVEEFAGSHSDLLDRMCKKELSPKKAAAELKARRIEEEKKPKTPPVVPSRELNLDTSEVEPVSNKPGKGEWLLMRAHKCYAKTMESVYGTGWAVNPDVPAAVVQCSKDLLDLIEIAKKDKV